MKQYKVISKINIFLLILILLLLFLGRYYELFSGSVSVLLLCSYLLYAVIALTVVTLIKYKKGSLQMIAIFGLIIFAFAIHFIDKNMFSSWKNHIIYSTNDLSIVARVNSSATGNRCDICVYKNGVIMKKVGEPLALPSDYDPIEEHYYEVNEGSHSLMVKIKCSENSKSYEEVEVKI